MLAYLERVHAGVRGQVTDAVTGLPVAAEVRVAGNPLASYADPDVGDFHRPLLPGRYDLEISGTGYATQLVPGVVVQNGSPATRVDVALSPLAVDLVPVNHQVLDGAGGDGFLAPGESSDLAVTLRDVAEAAGLRLGDLYRLYPDKAALIASFIARIDTEVLAGTPAKGDPEASQ